MDYIPGDVDMDGEITAGDARLALRRSVQLENYPAGSAQYLACDVDCDGQIMSGDARLILRASVSLEDPSEWKKQGSASNADPVAVTGGYRIAMITDHGDISDQSYNQIIYETCRDFCGDNGIAFTYFRSASDSDADRAAVIASAIAEGCNVIVLPGDAFGPAIRETAGRNPDVYFIALDVSSGDLGGDYQMPSNLYCANYQEELCGFMAGYAAVRLGYTRLGFLGGMAVPSVMRYGYGFVQGADAAAAELKLTDVSVNYAYGNQFYGDADITAAMDAWYQSGTQVVFACGGSIYTSVVDAAKKVEGAKIIGADVDQAAVVAKYAAGEGGSSFDYKDLTVTSAVKGFAPTVKTMLTAVTAGRFGDYGGKAETLGVVSEDPACNYVQLAGSTQFGEGFTVGDYAALVARLLSGASRVSNDITVNAANNATVVTVNDLGNIK